MDGWIKLHRSMTEWEWYQDINTKVLFIHLLLKANTVDKKWQGTLINRGQLISSYTHLASETGLTLAQIRRSVNALIRTGEIAHQNCNKYGLFTVVNYDKYQSNDTQSSSQTTVKRQSDNSQTTTTKEHKNNKNKDYSSDFETFWSVYPRKVEKAACYEKYKARLNDGCSVDILLAACEKYAAQCKKDLTPLKYIKHGSTFLSNKEPFMDYLSGSQVTFKEESIEYQLSMYYQKFRRVFDNKFTIDNIQDSCTLFSGLLKNGRDANEIYSVMKALYQSNNQYLIKKYLDLRQLCRDFSLVGSQLMLDRGGVNKND